MYRQWKNFEHKQNTTITTDWGFVKSNGPYNVIILFDVIDHLKIENPTEVLRKLGELLAPDGKIYMRCHPITSRHGTHLYHDLNKAYVHLVFTGEELRQLVPESKFQEKNIGSFYPVATYHQQIEDAGDFSKASIMHPIKTISHPLRVHYREKRNCCKNKEL